MIFSHQIYLAKGEVPSQSYKFFIDELLTSIRTQIAECLEKAYDRIRPENIGKMLYLSEPGQVKAYCQQVIKTNGLFKIILKLIKMNGQNIGKMLYLSEASQVKAYCQQVIRL